MRSTSLLAQLTLLTSTAHAFYPFDPAWHLALQQKDDDKRSVGGASSGSMTFGLKQRTHSTEQSIPNSIAREASRLLRKYARLQPPSSSAEDVAKRSYQYNIETANNPNKAMTVGVDQDGTDYSYFIPVEFGSKQTQLYMLIDTGAGSTWVMGSSCTSQACGMHDTFGSDDSSTLVTDSSTFSVSYGSGSVSGNLANDTISVAGMSFSYEFGLATNTSDDFVHFAFDGILGLSMETGSNPNFMQTVMNNKVLKQNIFAVALNRAGDGSDNAEISFGTTDSSRYTGDVVYTALESGEEWAIQIDDIAYDGTGADVGGIASYIDTGTSFIFGPPDLVKKVHSVIPDATSSDGVTYTVPCDSDKSLTFSFSGTEFEVSSKDWISPESSDGTCTSNIYGQDVVSGSWLLGDTFLKNVYAIFDMDQKRIGFATMSGSSSSNSSTDATSSSTSASSTASASGSSSTATGVSPSSSSQSGSGTSTGTSGAASSTATGGSNPKHSSAARGSPVQIVPYSLVVCTLAFFALMA